MTLDTYFRNLFQEIIGDLVKETSSKQSKKIEEALSKTQTIQNPYYTIKEASKYLGCSGKTIRKWISEGKIKANQIAPKMNRIRKNELDQMGKITSEIDTTSIAQEITQNILQKML